MIRQPDLCPTEAIKSLLRDELEQGQHDFVTSHLDSCTNCQQMLESNFTQEALLKEAKRYVSEETAIAGLKPDTTLAHIAPSASDQQLTSSKESLGGRIPAKHGHWVLGLLQPADGPEFIGRINDLHVSRVIGQGGMGVVLQAWDKELQRFLAVKLLSPMLSHSGVARQRFLREAQSTAAVVHPNIVPIFAISPDQDLPHIVMPYIGGGNLQQLIDQNGPLPLQRTLALGLQVAEGLAAAHQQGIIHRDIKPANLMLDEGGFRVMLTDFGLARALDEASLTGATLTGTGAVAGTPQYMSPEQARGEVVDHRTDLYSMGAVLFALATGHTPINASSTLEILRKIGKEKATPVAEINESYPLWFQSVVDRFMHPVKEKRIQTAEEASQLLRDTLAHVRAPTRIPLPNEFGSSSKTTSKRAIVAGLVVAIAAILGGFFGPRLQWETKSGPSLTSPETNSSRAAPKQSSPGPAASNASQFQSEASSESVQPLQNSSFEQAVDWHNFEQINQDLDGLEMNLRSLEFELQPFTAPKLDTQKLP